MVGPRGKGRATVRVVALLVAALGLGLGLWSCNDSQAQGSGTRIAETFSANADSFRLLADEVPTLAVTDGATTYTLRSSGSVSFVQAGDAVTTTLGLETGDVVIERPAAGLITVVRPQ